MRKPIQYDNLRLIRSFTGQPDEAAFILVHVAMVAHSPGQVRAALRALEAAREGDLPGLARALRSFRKVMRVINDEMETMWHRSSPEAYKTFRTFIMGIKSQPMFPNGVVYEGVASPSGEGDRHQYRGESGANDSIVPTADNLLQVPTDWGVAMVPFNGSNFLCRSQP